MIAGCNKASMSLMKVQLKIFELLHPEDWKSDDDDDGDDIDIVVEKVVVNDSGSGNTAHVAADSEGDIKSSESPGSDFSV